MKIYIMHNNLRTKETLVQSATRLELCFMFLSSPVIFRTFGAQKLT